MERRGIEPRISGCKPNVFPLALTPHFPHLVTGIEPANGAHAHRVRFPVGYPTLAGHVCPFITLSAESGWWESNPPNGLFPKQGTRLESAPRDYRHRLSRQSMSPRQAVNRGTRNRTRINWFGISCLTIRLYPYFGRAPTRGPDHSPKAPASRALRIAGATNCHASHGMRPRTRLHLVHAGRTLSTV